MCIVSGTMAVTRGDITGWYKHHHQHFISGWVRLMWSKYDQSIVVALLLCMDNHISLPDDSAGWVMTESFLLKMMLQNQLIHEEKTFIIQPKHLQGYIQLQNCGGQRLQSCYNGAANQIVRESVVRLVTTWDCGVNIHLCTPTSA